MILQGDCLEELKKLEANSLDSMVTDPPAGIAFMGKDWDKDKGGRENWVSWMREVMQECLRVLKPGAHALVWAIPRTSHWTATALEDAGFNIIDICVHVFGSGFPKSLNVRKSGAKSGIACRCELPDLSQDTSETASKPSTQILRSPVHVECEEQTIGCENLRSMQEALDAENQGAAGSKQNLRTELQRQAHKPVKSGQTVKARRNMPNLPQGILDKKPGIIEGDLLQLQMQGYRETSGSQILGSSEENCTQYERAEGNAAVWSQESSLEGWRDFQTEQRELHRSEICEMPEGISSNGTQGRLHHGAPSDHGDEHGTHPYSNGSSASQGPQYQEQSHLESGILSKQRGPQTCGSCGKAIIPEGLGTALKPASEHWILVRKPCSEKTVAANVLKWGCGGLNIDASRIGLAEGDDTSRKVLQTQSWKNTSTAGVGSVTDDWKKGRFPANLVLSHNPDCVEVGTKKVKAISGGTKSVDTSKAGFEFGSGEEVNPFNYASPDGTETVSAFECTEGCAVAELDRQSGNLKSGKLSPHHVIKERENKSKGKESQRHRENEFGGDSGGASRFFYCAKASKSDKGEGNIHPTVKATKLMTYLITMITPPGGIVLDPFAGSGSTGVAAIKAGFNFLGIEREKEYVEIANKRIYHALPEFKKQVYSGEEEV